MQRRQENDVVAAAVSAMTLARHNYWSIDYSSQFLLCTLFCFVIFLLLCILVVLLVVWNTLRNGWITNRGGTVYQAEYAVSYGAKFCDLHGTTIDQFSAPTVIWINSVRKCLQVELVPLLRLCRRPPTCEEIRKTAFQSHQPCYFNPYGGFSVCEVTSSVIL